MSDEVKADAVEDQPKKETKTPEVETISKTDFEAALEKNRREWQSKIDTILNEKKVVSEKALTVEQRIEQIEKEREAERLSWSRKEAKAAAQIADELDGYIRAYSGNDPEKIREGAEGIKGFLDAVISSTTDQAVKAALEKVGSQPAPRAGGSEKVLSLEAFNKMAPKEQAKFMSEGGEIEQ